jgi:hypothetical protein
MASTSMKHQVLALAVVEMRTSSISFSERTLLLGTHN